MSRLAASRARTTRRCRPTRRCSTRSRTSRSSPARTERVRLGTHVYNIGLRHPFTAARGVQTVDVALGRPLRVRHRRVVARGGVGRGRARLRDTRPARRRGDRGLQAAVDRGRRSRTTASSSTFDEVVFEPKPVQRPWPPILVGGESKAALRRAARLGDGWIGMGHTFESAAAQIAALRDVARRARPRRRARFQIVPRRPGRVARRRRALGGARRHPADRLAVAAFEGGRRGCRGIRGQFVENTLG